MKTCFDLMFASILTNRFRIDFELNFIFKIQNKKLYIRMSLEMECFLGYNSKNIFKQNISAIKMKT